MQPKLGVKESCFEVSSDYVLAPLFGAAPEQGAQQVQFGRDFRTSGREGARARWRCR